MVVHKTERFYACKSTNNFLNGSGRVPAWSCTSNKAGTHQERKWEIIREVGTMETVRGLSKTNKQNHHGKTL